MGWAASEWHVVKAHALMDGIITTNPGGPASLLDLSGDHLLTYVEALIRRMYGDEQLDELYELARPPAPVVRDESRRRQIEELEAMFNG